MRGFHRARFRPSQRSNAGNDLDVFCSSPHVSLRSFARREQRKIDSATSIASIQQGNEK
jgi:hypothetical protein